MIQSILDVATAVLDHQLAPMVVATVGIVLSVQGVKFVAKQLGIREHPQVDQALPLLPLLLGTLVFGAFPHEVAVDAVVDNGHHSIHLFGAFLGFGIGFASIGLFHWLLRYAPDPVADRLRVESEEDGDDSSN